MFRNQSFSRKVLFISLSYTISLGVLLVFLVQGMSDKLSFTQMERNGNEYQRQLQMVRDSMLKHGMLSGLILRGDTRKQEERDRVAQDVENALKGLKQVDEKLGKVLQFTAESLAKRNRENRNVATLKRDWDGLRGELASLPLVPVLEKHTKLLNHIKIMETHAGDQSNLILDPDLDSYYVMDLTLLALPQAQERVNEILFTLMKMSTDEKVRAEEKTTLKILTNKLRTVDLDRVIASANTALNEDENFFGVSQSLQSNFTQPLNEVSTFLTRFATLTDSIADGEAATDDVVAIAEAASQAQSGLIKFWHVGSKELDELLNARVAHQERNFILAVSLSLLCIVGSGILSVFITRRLTAPFIVAVTRLKKEATTTKLASHNLSHAAQGLSVSSVQQSEAIHETVAASAQMSSMVSQTAHHANEASRNAAEVSLMTKEGGNIMRQMVDSMETIQHATSQLVDVQKIIDEISAKTDIINDIVFKTQLLSFNASIEAARAGQHGLGFAVVAEEVGNLAQLSGNAATEIEVLLQNSRRKVSDIVEQMHVRVKDGNIVSTEALEKFNEIAARISTISEQAENIRQATNEQEKGIRQTSKAMEQMNKMLEQNAHVAKKTAHSSDDLKAQSQKLDKIAMALNLLLQGRRNSEERKLNLDDLLPDSSKEQNSTRMCTESIEGSAHHGDEDRRRDSEHSMSPETLLNELERKATALHGDESKGWESEENELSADDSSFRKVA